jgi:signal transduction histidine kinase
MLGQNLEQLFPRSTVLGEPIHRAIERRESVRSQLVDLGRQNGHHTRLLVNVEVLRKSGDQHHAGILVTFRDAETRREIELQLDISSRLAAISRLTGGVAHEIKNPLNAIALHLEVLRTKSEPVEPEIEVIAREIKRLDNVVKTFLNFNRPLEVQARALDLAALAKDVVSLIEPDAASKGVRVETELNHACWVNGDDDLLRQAILNIVVNGVEAMKNGGRLTLTSGQTGGQCELRIADEGPGIAPELREKIFNLYFSTKEQGSGIGLAMTFRIVQLHSGKIDVVSEVGKGTTFLLRFPMLRTVEAAPAMVEPVST